jgi:hypothetical protein
MSNEEIFAALRNQRNGGPATELADVLAKLIAQPLSQSSLVFYFKHAFPEIPLRALLEAGSWQRVGGNLSDAEVNRLLAPWLG